MLVSPKTMLYKSWRKPLQRSHSPLQSAAAQSTTTAEKAQAEKTSNTAAEMKPLQLAREPQSTAAPKLAKKLLQSPGEYQSTAAPGNYFCRNRPVCPIVWLSEGNYHGLV